jgi:hypothetical protein
MKRTKSFNQNGILVYPEDERREAMLIVECK